MRITDTYIKVTNSDNSIAVADFFKSARIETLQNIQPDRDITIEGLTELPEFGEIEVGMYNYQGQVVFCHQKHDRTIYEPIQTPALFSFFRVNTDELEWIINEKVESGWKIMYEGIQYECIQSHMTLEGWTPDKTATLWKLAATGEILPWGQPTGAHDAYNIGDKVSFNGSNYESLINANVWSPAAYPAGWRLL